MRSWWAVGIGLCRWGAVVDNHEKPNKNDKNYSVVPCCPGSTFFWKKTWWETSTMPKRTVDADKTKSRIEDTLLAIAELIFSLFCKIFCFSAFNSFIDFDETIIFHQFYKTIFVWCFLDSGYPLCSAKSKLHCVAHRVPNAALHSVPFNSHNVAGVLCTLNFRKCLVKRWLMCEVGSLRWLDYRPSIFRIL